MYFRSSVAVDATADETFAYLHDDAHLRAFVGSIEPDETFTPAEASGAGGSGTWFAVAPLRHHRIDWHGSHSHGYVEVLHRGDAADIVADVVTHQDGADLDRRLDAALFALQDSIEALQATADGVPRPEASASQVVAHVLRGLIRHLPSDRRRQLDPYLRRAPQLDPDPEKESARAAVCRAWAERAAETGHDGLGRRVIGFTEHVRHGLTAVDEGLLDAEYARSGVPNGVRAELDATSEAVGEAADLAAHVGWDAVPWNELLDELFAV